jgi:precorrin-2 dehydrogenase/sirohydrochlorin ferrochelatase
VALYPIFVELAGRSCLVIGGGGVAAGKVEGLLAAGAIVTVVSPALSPPLLSAVARSGVTYLPREYRDGDLAGVALAFAATGDSTVNGAVAAEGRRRGVWVNAADDPAHCDFILPSVLRRGALAVAVSTGGASPAAARAVREELERHLGEDYGALVEIAGEVRRALRVKRRNAPASAWSAALHDPGLRRLLASGRRTAASQKLRARLEAS